MIPFVSLVWVGMVLGVSFLATPIKFRAKSLTLPVALDVGRATFHAFGKVEWVLGGVLAGGIAMQQFGDGEAIGGVAVAGAIVAVGIVVVQAVWLIPKLDVRVAATIAGTPLDKSHLHTVFAVLEAVKAVGLVAVGLVA